MLSWFPCQIKDAHPQHLVPVPPKLLDDHQVDPEQRRERAVAQRNRKPRQRGVPNQVHRPNVDLPPKMRTTDPPRPARHEPRPAVIKTRTHVPLRGMRLHPGQTPVRKRRGNRPPSEPPPKRAPAPAAMPPPRQQNRVGDPPIVQVPVIAPRRHAPVPAPPRARPPLPKLPAKRSATVPVGGGMPPRQPGHEAEPAETATMNLTMNSTSKSHRPILRLSISPSDPVRWFLFCSSLGSRRKNPPKSGRQKRWPRVAI